MPEPEERRVLGIDFGRVRTGVALSDPTGTVVRPLEPVERANSPTGITAIARLVREHDVGRVVVGLPLGLDGASTRQTEQARSFAARLRGELELVVELHDERYTSKLADRTRSETGTTASRDSLAACHILESWFADRTT